jgi:hypothetical protein
LSGGLATGARSEAAQRCGEACNVFYPTQNFIGIPEDIFYLFFERLVMPRLRNARLENAFERST